MDLSGKPNCFLLHIHHALPAHRWGLSTTLSSSLGVPVSPGFSTVSVRHCLATVSEDPTEQALSHITLFITSDAKCIPEPLELWRPARYQDFLSPLFMWNTLLQCSQNPGRSPQRVYREKHTGQASEKHRAQHSPQTPSSLQASTLSSLSRTLASPHKGSCRQGFPSDMITSIISSVEDSTASFEPQFDLSGDQSCPGSTKCHLMKQMEFPSCRVWQLCVCQEPQPKTRHQNKTFAYHWHLTSVQILSQEIGRT